MAGIPFGGTMASGAAAAAVSLSEASREQFIRQLELANDFELALAQERSFGAFGFDLHLYASMHADFEKSKHNLRIRK